MSHIKTTLARWTKFLKKAHHYDKASFPEELKAEPAIEKAFYRLNTLSLDKEEREIYEARLKWLRDEDATLQRAHEKGIEKGIEQIALNMLKANKPLHEISLLTGLFEEAVVKLKNGKMLSNPE